MRIEVTLKKYFAGLSYDAYSVKLPEGEMINMRLSKSVFDAPKPKELDIPVDLNKLEKGKIENAQIYEYQSKVE